MFNQPNIPKFLVLDAVRLTQVLMNFISNAIKFTDKGEIKVETKWIPDADSIIPEERNLPA